MVNHGYKWKSLKLQAPLLLYSKITTKTTLNYDISKSYPDSTISATAKAWTITQNGQTIDICVNPRNDPPTGACFRKSGISAVAAHLGQSVVSIANQNLSEPQKESLRWHCCLGHVGLQTIQFMMRSGAPASSEGMRQQHTQASKISHQDLPKCAACQFRRQCNRPKPGHKQKVI